mmetsp:Transcript_25116/g.75393  ORF Transcript_25116/g.75393 Transcript_25116/m.75393 type:complete len:131 (+) Transcript_25116:186-578(+)|eukprot:CAMPEP_0119266782 /NCGR_PEP_ID=MMETSP1329-20130426/5156_1 /TAXON_ID=114041 /ORGANISM="Genus nov. species nov., Strain RCC1024" /LENGTH=130 /DNA_ID=CAMNT_0007266679 /DNA_START=168 /DNA_END=560 /DNA_ORIENTATION=+
MQLSAPLLALLYAAPAAAFQASAFQPAATRGRGPVAVSARAGRGPAPLAATRRGRDGKIYVGEPEPWEEALQGLGGLLDGIGRGVEGLLGPQPVVKPIPIPVEDLPKEAEGSAGVPPPKRPFDLDDMSTW